jgi:hypothetical protein
MPTFGSYQDAMTLNEWSAVSLLDYPFDEYQDDSPQEVIDKAICLAI